MKPLLLLISMGLFAGAFYAVPHYKAHTTVPLLSSSPKDINPEATLLTRQAATLKKYALAKGFSTHYCFLIDMHLPSGKKRFFIYDLQGDSVLISGLVAHGSGGPFLWRMHDFLIPLA